MNEKKKMWMHRLIWLGLTVFVILLSVIINAAKPKLKIVDSECSIDYFSPLDKTDCKITLYFNRNVYDGYAVINFYDTGNVLLDSKEEYFFNDGNLATNIFCSVNGEVSFYEIVSYDFEPSDNVYFIYYFLIITIPMLICSFLISYKECNINGKLVSVYAGFYHHTLRIDGELCDEHNTLFTYSPIKLGATDKDGSKIEATISLSNRIAIKVNDKLYKNDNSSQRT